MREKENREVLVVSDWTYGYHREPILSNNISFTVLSGGLVVLVGISGAGKSSLLQSLFDSGIRISGQLRFHANSSSQSLQFGYMPQSAVGESPLVSVRDIVADGYGHSLGFTTSKSAYTAADELLQDCGLRGLDRRRIIELSGGQQARVLFARAILMAKDSRIVCMDEPTANLDAKTSSMIYKLINKYREQGFGFIIVSHDLDFALNNADTIVSIRDRQANVIGKNEFESSGFLDSLFGEGL